MRIAKRCVCCDSADLAVLMPFVAARAFGWESMPITPDWGLRDLPTGWAHALCATLACRACGLLFLDMRFDADEMAALYADYRGPDYRELRARYEPGYGARNAILERGSTYIPTVEAILAPHLPPAPRVLDWGGDTGLNTPFRGRAALHHVFEISHKALVPGAERVGPDAVGGHVYDLVAAMQVLEHVPEPRDVLRAMGAALGDDTILYLEVPHEAPMRDEPDPDRRRLAKRHWHEHVNFFTEASLRAALSATGLEAVLCLSHPVEAGGRIGHVLSVIARKGHARDATASDAARDLS